MLLVHKKPLLFWMAKVKLRQLITKSN